MSCRLTFLIATLAPFTTMIQHRKYSKQTLTRKYAEFHTASRNFVGTSIWGPLHSMGTSPVLRSFWYRRHCSLLTCIQLCCHRHSGIFANLTSCRRAAATICLRPCKLTISSYLFARWHLFWHVGYLRHQQQVDLWPFDLEGGVRVTCDVCYLCANFSLPRPLCSRVRLDERDRRQTSVRQTSDKSIA